LGFGGETRREKRKEIPFYSAGPDRDEQQRMVWDCVQIFAISLASAVTAEGALSPLLNSSFLLDENYGNSRDADVRPGGSAVVAAHLPNGELLQSAGQGREAHQEAYAHINLFDLYFIY
jgi:hypothetical protein